MINMIVSYSLLFAAKLIPVLAMCLWNVQKGFHEGVFSSEDNKA